MDKVLISTSINGCTLTLMVDDQIAYEGTAAVKKALAEATDDLQSQLNEMECS